MSEEKGDISRLSGRQKDQLADALASMSGSTEQRASPRNSEAPPPDLADDQTIAPPLQVQDFIPERPVAHDAIDRAINTRRTLIPVLLTLGVMLPAVASLKWFSDPESPFATWPAAAAWLLVLVGIVLLLIAIANMLQVRELIARRGQHAD